MGTETVQPLHVDSQPELVTLASGESVQMTYDAAGRIKTRTVTVPGPTPAVMEDVEFFHNAEGSTQSVMTALIPTATFVVVGT